MANLELLTLEENAFAQTQGWLVSHVFDQSKWRVAILSASPAVKNAELATQLVVAYAQRNSPLHIKALRLVVGSHKGKK